MPIASRAASSFAGVPPGGRSRSGATARIAGERQATGDIADMVVKAAIFVDHDHGRLAASGCAEVRRHNLVAAGQPLRLRRLATRRGSFSGTIAAAAGEAAMPATSISAAATLPASLTIRRHEVAPLHAVMGEAVVEQDRLLLTVHHVIAARLRGWAAA